MGTKSLDKYISSTALGVNFEKRFGVADKLGELIDLVLYTKDSYFNPSFFPRVHSAVNVRELVNEVTRNRLAMNESSLIFEYFFQDEFTQSSLEDIISQYLNWIFTPITKEGKISGLTRIGFVTKFDFDDPSYLGSLIDKFPDFITGDQKTFNLRFSRGIPCEESFAVKAKDDYFNVIFSLLQTKEESVFIVDYQRIISPARKLDSSFVRDFVSSARTYTNKVIQKWFDAQDEEND